MNKKPRRQAALNVRIATPEDAPAIVDLSKRVYPDMPPYSVGAIIGQIANFQGGQNLRDRCFDLDETDWKRRP